MSKGKISRLDEGRKFNWPEPEEEPYRADEIEFKNWNVLINNVMRSGRWSNGPVKVIPPASWKPCPLTFDEMLEMPIYEPFHQHVRQIHIDKTIKSFNRYESAKKARNGIGFQYGFYHYEPGVPPENFPEVTKVRHLYDLSQSRQKSDETIEQIEREYWNELRSTSHDKPSFIATYGTDTVGSISSKVSDDITLYDLPTPLSWISKRYSYSPVGIATPLLYFGCRNTAFTCHQEDSNLASVSLLHKGAVKIWYSLSDDQAPQFDALVKSCIPNYKPDGEQTCNAPCRHKRLMIDPLVLHRAGFKVKRHLQRENELMILPPSVYHFGLNTNFNISESVNFISDGWIDHGLTAEMCKCTGEDAVPRCLEMEMYVYEMMPERYNDLVNGRYAIQHPLTKEDIVVEWENLINKDDDSYDLNANGVTCILGGKTVGDQDYVFVHIGEVKRFMRKELVEKLKWNGCGEPVKVDKRFFEYGNKPAIYAVDGKVKRWDGAIDEPPILCPQCNKDMRKTIGKTDRINRHLNSCNVKNYDCSVCGTRFGRNDNLLSHVRRNHPGTELPYKKPKRNLL